MTVAEYQSVVLPQGCRNVPCQAENLLSLPDYRASRTVFGVQEFGAGETERNQNQSTAVMHGWNQTLSLVQPSLPPGNHIVVVIVAALAKQGEDLQASKKLTCCPYHSTDVPKNSTMAVHGWTGKHSVAQLTQAVLLVVVVRNDVKAGEPAVVGKMGEACFYSQVFHDQ